MCRETECERERESEKERERERKRERMGVDEIRGVIFWPSGEPQTGVWTGLTLINPAVISVTPLPDPDTRWMVHSLYLCVCVCV